MSGANKIFPAKAPRGQAMVNFVDDDVVDNDDVVDKDDDVFDDVYNEIYIMMQCLSVTFLFIPALPPSPVQSCYDWIKRKEESRK